MNARVQIWMNRMQFIQLCNLLESRHTVDRLHALVQFENEEGPIMELQVALEEARSNNANFDVAEQE